MLRQRTIARRKHRLDESRRRDCYHGRLYVLATTRHVSPQRPTRLRLVNIGSELHDFTAADFFKTVDLRDPSVIGSSGISITVEPHLEKDVDFIARLPGHFGLICADHDWAGMTADIFVE